MLQTGIITLLYLLYILHRFERNAHGTFVSLGRLAREGEVNILVKSIDHAFHFREYLIKRVSIMNKQHTITREGVCTCINEYT